ncbi:MAG: hypothetical protein ACRD12_02080 [Acidimicrobiales bacterium]
MRETAGAGASGIAHRVVLALAGTVVAAAAFFLLAGTAQAGSDDRATRQAEIAARQAEREADVTARNAARQAEIAQRQAVRHAEVAIRHAIRHPEEMTLCDCRPAGGTGSPALYTTDADFDRGESNNVEHTPSDQLQLKERPEPFPYLWVAVSEQPAGATPFDPTFGTIVKIDTRTGQIVGEYASAPDNRPANPSRTTVDPWGNVWATNRFDNSVVRIGLVENHQCVDHNGIPGIQTSTGAGNVLPWPNTSGVDTNGGVDTAMDDCVLSYVRTTASGTRHISISTGPEMGVWVSGTGVNVAVFDLIDPMQSSDPTQAAIIRTEGPTGSRPAGTLFGGYGGLTDRNGFLWSAAQSASNGLLRWNTAFPLVLGPNATGYPNTFITGGGADFESYGLCIDSLGNVWNTSRYNDQIRKFGPNGVLLGTFTHGAQDAQGCAVDANDHVWVAHIIGSTTVGHLDSSGTFLETVVVPQGPTGLALDRDGNVWVTSFNDQTASRIVPDHDPAGGFTSVVDFTTATFAGRPYNYSDMTGSTLPVHAKSGSWEVVYDCGPTAPEGLWGPITMTALVPGDAKLIVTAASSVDGVTFSPPIVVAPGAVPAVPAGRYLKVRVVFVRATDNRSPVLEDLTIRGFDPSITDCCDEPPAPVPPLPPKVSPAPVLPSVGAPVVISVPGRPALPRTGASLSLLVLLAGLALAGGLTAVTLERRI